MIVNGYDYPDSCIIERESYDSNGGLLPRVEIYSGACEIQYGGGGDTSLQVGTYQSKPIVFLPISNVAFKINDIVTITSLNDRITTYTIGQFESIADFGDTVIWLKGGVDE